MRISVCPAINMARSPFLESIRQVMRTKHYSIQTEKTYLRWIKRFILFNKKRPPKDMKEQEVTDFLTYLVVNRQVTASTQNLALCAIVLIKAGTDIRMVQELLGHTDLKTTQMLTMS